MEPKSKLKIGDIVRIKTLKEMIETIPRIYRYRYQGRPSWYKAFHEEKATKLWKVINTVDNPYDSYTSVNLQHGLDFHLLADDMVKKVY